jgi:hypothetical protein
MGSVRRTHGEISRKTLSKEITWETDIDGRIILKLI